MKTANPILTRSECYSAAVSGEATMTCAGTVHKTALLSLMVLATSIITWNLTSNQNPAVGGLIALGAIGGFIVALITVFKQEWASTTAPIYALLEGLLLGSVSAVAEKVYPGIVMQAVLATFGVFFGFLAIYYFNIITVTDKLRLGIVAVTLGIGITYLMTFIGSLFGFHFPMINGSGWLSIGFSLFVIIIAAFNLMLDFDFIEASVKRGAPKHMEWYAAFGLLVTIIWLYFEILRLLYKLKGRD
jgi:uncharacterized YccA/Bax inhibitor family protein